MPPFLTAPRARFVAATTLTHLLLACGWAYGPLAGAILAVLLAALIVSCLWIGAAAEQERHDLHAPPVRDWDRA